VDAETATENGSEMKIRYRYWDTIAADVGRITRCMATGELSDESVCLRYQHPGICPYWHQMGTGCGVFDVCAYPTKPKEKEKDG
jgi:hypothetical protein